MEKQKIQISRSFKKVAMTLIIVMGFAAIASAQEMLDPQGIQKIKTSGSYVDYIVSDGFNTTVSALVRIGNDSDEIPVGSLTPIMIYSTNRKNKCLSVREVTNLANGTNILLWPCENGNVYQQWLFDGTQLRYNDDPTKCLDLSKYSTSNGTNIHLWQCNGSKGQQWIYDGVSKQIRYQDNWNKCLSRPRADDIQIWDCSGHKTLQWTFEGATSFVDQKGKSKRIKLAKDEVWCIDVTNKDQNVDLEEFNSGDVHHWWVFEDHKIRQNAKQNGKAKCMHLKNHKTDDGTNVVLADCSDTPAQEWIYDGKTRTIRSRLDPDKCLNAGSLDSKGRRRNIALYPCIGSWNQVWVLENKN